MTTSNAIAPQYHSTLRMLEQCIERCPEPLWLAAPGESPNRTWHIAYHSLFYVHFYLAPGDKEFTAWHLHRTEYNFLGEIPSKPGHKPAVDVPYSQAELLEYAKFCHDEVDIRVPALDLGAPSGFYWLPFTKLELQFYTLRHLAHHTGQLSERIRTYAGISIPWGR